MTQKEGGGELRSSRSAKKVETKLKIEDAKAHAGRKEWQGPTEVLDANRRCVSNVGDSNGYLCPGPKCLTDR